MNAPSPGRVAAVARVVVLLAWRQRLLGLLVALGAALALATLGFRSLGFGVGEIDFLRSGALGLLGLVSALVAVVGMAPLVGAEPGRVDSLLATPLDERELVLGHLAAALALQALVLVPLGALAGAVLELRAGELALAVAASAGPRPEALEGAAASLVAGLASLALRGWVVAAGTLALAAWTRSWAGAVVGGFLLLAAGLLQPLAAAAWRPDGDWAGRLAWAVVRVVPDLGRFDPEAGLPGAAALGAAACWGIAFGVVAWAGLRRGRLAA